LIEYGDIDHTDLVYVKSTLVNHTGNGYSVGGFKIRVENYSVYKTEMQSNINN